MLLAAQPSRLLERAPADPNTDPGGRALQRDHKPTPAQRQFAQSGDAHPGVQMTADEQQTGRKSDGDRAQLRSATAGGDVETDGRGALGETGEGDAGQTRAARVNRVAGAAEATRSSRCGRGCSCSAATATRSWVRASATAAPAGSTNSPPRSPPGSRSS